MPGAWEPEEPKFCARAYMSDNLSAGFGRLARLVRNPTHCSRDEQQQQQQSQPSPFSRGSIDPIAEDEAQGDVSQGSKGGDLEQALSTSSSSSVR